MATRRRRRFIARAVKRPGALTRAVGGPPSKNLGRVRALARRRDRTGRQARFYLNVLRPAAAKRRKKRRRR